jgi:regulator of sigma E protease
VTLLTILVVVAVFAVLVLIHEFGHFVAAKRSGVRVDEFGLGFPPRLLGWRRGETLYSLNAIPLGGFVRLFGEEGEGKNDSRSFISQSAGVRARILVMGVIMNLLLAYVIICGLFLFQTPLFIGQPEDYPGAKITSQSVHITRVEKDSPAATAGVKVGDVVLALNGQRVGSDRILKEMLEERAGQPVELLVKRGGENVSLKAQLRAEKERGALGVGLAQSQSVKLPLWSVPVVAAIEEVRLVWRTLQEIVGIFTRLLVSAEAPAGIVGPIGISAVIGQILSLGLVPLARLVAVLSVSLAVFNALPIPALDGGRLAFIGIEKLAGRRIKAAVENAAHTVGIWLLLLLIVGISLYDIYRLKGGGLGL